MKKMLALLLALVMVLSLAACASSQPAAASTETAETTETTEPAAEESAEAPAESGKTYTVGVCQLVQHEALDAATQGFIDALKEELGDAVTVDVQNASGDSVNCGTIVNGFVSKGVDLIMANATPALTAAVSATADIPILGTSITAYGVALDIDDFSGTVGGNVSGTSDLADLQKQAQMILDWFPETKTVGLLFCSAEPNSRYQIDEVRKALEAQGVTCEEFAFTAEQKTVKISVTQKAASTEPDPTDKIAGSLTTADALSHTFPYKEPQAVKKTLTFELEKAAEAETRVKLYDEGLEKGRAEADRLVAEAKKEAAKIVAEARAQAEDIVRKAQDKAEDVEKNTMTEISLAGKQAAAKIKSEIAAMIVAKSTAAGVREAVMDPAFIKEMLLSVAKNWNGADAGKVELKALLPEADRAKLDEAFGKSAQELLSAGIEVGYSKEVKTGFKVGAKEGGYYISFSDADFDALLGEYLREKVSDMLFKA